MPELITVRIQGHVFTFEPEPLSVRCATPEHDLFPVATVLHSAWHRSPLTLLHAVQRRGGLGLDAAGFSYDVDEETIAQDLCANSVDGVDPRLAVRCRVMREVTYVAPKLWHELIVRYGRFALQFATGEEREKPMAIAAELDRFERSLENGE